MAKIILYPMIHSSINLEGMNEVRATYINKLKGERQLSSFLAWKALKDLVNEEYHLNIDELVLKYNEYGKPYFDEFDFSISHSKDIIMVGISKNKIGVDIQVIDKKDYSKIAKYLNMDNNSYEVIKRFSSIEAYLKKIGSGFAMFKKDLNPTNYQEKIEYKNYQYIVSIDSSEDIQIVNKL